MMFVVDNPTLTRISVYCTMTSGDNLEVFS